MCGDFSPKAQCSWIKMMLSTWSPCRVSDWPGVCIMIHTQSGLEVFSTWGFMESAVVTSEGCWVKGFQSAVVDSLKLVCLGAFKMSGLGPFSKTHVSDLKRKRGVLMNGLVNLHACVNVNTLHRLCIHSKKPDKIGYIFLWKTLLAVSKQ